MVYEYRHQLKLYEVGSYLIDYLDEYAIVPFAGTIHNSLESYVRFLLMNDYHQASQLKATLTRLLPPECVEPLADTIHDLLLSQLRPFLNLDEGESVVSVRVQRNYDIEVIVEELDGAHLIQA
jgi:hypothetical protein